MIFYLWSSYIVLEATFFVIFVKGHMHDQIHFIWGYAKFIYCHEIEEVGPFLESMELDNISHNFLYNLG